jgi:hypothetical protein
MMMADEGRELMAVAEDQSESPLAFNGTRISDNPTNLYFGSCTATNHFRLETSRKFQVERTRVIFITTGSALGPQE